MIFARGAGYIQRLVPILFFCRYPRPSVHLLLSVPLSAFFCRYPRPSVLPSSSLPFHPFYRYPLPSVQAVPLLSLFLLLLPLSLPISSRLNHATAFSFLLPLSLWVSWEPCTVSCSPIASHLPQSPILNLRSLGLVSLSDQLTRSSQQACLKLG
jgi:hypothetical protein